MPDTVKTPVYSYMEADYLDLGNETTPNYQLMEFFTTHNESPNAQTTDKTYVPHKNATVITTGYQTQFPINFDEYENDEVSAFIRDIAEEQKLGVTCNYCKVRLHQPVEASENTYYARKFVVGFAIDSITREGGAIKTIEGNLNAQGDVVIGTFNTTTKTFTANPGGV